MLLSISQTFRFFGCLVFLLSLAEDISARTCRIVFLDRPASAPKTLFLFDGKDIREVEVPRLNLSPVYHLPDGNLNLRFFLSAPANLENMPESGPSIIIPETTNNVYLLLTSNPENEVAPVSVQAVSADSTNFSRGQMLWFNLTDKRVGGNVGSENLDIQPHSRKRVSEPHRGHGDYPVELYFFIEGDGHLHPLMESRWRHDPRSRSLVFIANNGNRRAPRVFSFSDFRSE